MSLPWQYVISPLAPSIDAGSMAFAPSVAPPLSLLAAAPPPPLSLVVAAGGDQAAHQRGAAEQHG